MQTQEYVVNSIVPPQDVFADLQSSLRWCFDALMSGNASSIVVPYGEAQTLLFNGMIAEDGGDLCEHLGYSRISAISPIPVHLVYARRP